jgi:hypothetical protein
VIGDVDMFSNVEFEFESNAAKMGIPLTEKNIYFYM